MVSSNTLNYSIKGDYRIIRYVYFKLNGVMRYGRDVDAEPNIAEMISDIDHFLMMVGNDEEKKTALYRFFVRNSRAKSTITSCLNENQKINFELLKEYFAAEFDKESVPLSKLELIDLKNIEQCLSVLVYLSQYVRGNFRDGITRQYSRGRSRRPDVVRYDCNALIFLFDDYKLECEFLFRRLVLFFDLYSETREEKEDLFDDLMGKWKDSSNDSKLNRWLSNNKEIGEWACRYIVNNYFDGKPELWFGYLANNGKHELALRVFFGSIWDLHVERELLFTKMTRAGAQEKYRNNLKGRTPVNVAMSDDVRSKLKFLAEHGNKKIYKVIEDLISEEYKSVMKSRP